MLTVPFAVALFSQPPANVRLLTKELQNDSTVVWEPSPGGFHPDERKDGARPGPGLATGYDVLWRDTAAPDWQHAQAVGNVTRATLPLSKDNAVFAVRALDAKGHRSLAVVPMPER